MGFKDILNFTVKHDPFKEGAQPYMPPEEKQRVLEQANELRKDINDPDFHFDPMGDDYDEQQSLDNPKNDKDRIEFAKIKKQKQIDDKKIRLIHTALEKGIPLDDDIYRELLDVYPYYQEKLRDRQASIKRIKGMRDEVERQGKVSKYKFEDKIRGRNNLNFIDVETVAHSPKEHDYAYYEQFLAEYQKDLVEIQKLHSTIEEDVIKEDHAEMDVKRHLQEEIITEKRLGSRYLTRISDEEAGSTIEKVNKQSEASIMIQQFLKEYEQNIQKEEDAEKAQKLKGHI